MKKVLLMAVTALMSVTTLFAQSAEEIVSRMDAEMEKHKSEGLIMTMDIKILLVGNISTQIMSLGDKYCGRLADGGTVTWGDGETTWTYDANKNELTIDNASKNAGAESNADDMLSGITKGYDVKLKSETDNAWYLKCKKSKDNKSKDDPKKMDLVVDKATYYPISLSSKVAIASVTIHDVSFGVTEDQVTFNPDAYPTAKIIDKRQ